MSRIHPGPDPARPRHGATPSCPDTDPGTGWCLPCYEQGAFTLASGPDNTRCVMHGALLQDQAPDPCGYGIRAVAPSRRAPRGRAARSTDRGGPTTGPGRAPRPRARQRATERAMARGLQRARRRLNAGEFTPHPGWRHFIEAGYRVLTSQTEALADIARRVDDEEWRTDKRHSWALILRRLVLHMDWTTGLITGLTAERLGEAGARAPRTVSRVLAWARDSGLVVVVEAGATAESRYRHQPHPTYALVTDRPLPSPKATAPSPLSPVDESGDLPTSNVSSKPLTDGRRAQPTPQPRWPSHAVPGNPGERNAATFTLVSRLGLDGRQAGKIEIWRARAILKTWWDQEPASPASCTPSTTTPTGPTATAATPAAAPTTHSACWPTGSSPGGAGSTSSPAASSDTGSR